MGKKLSELTEKATLVAADIMHLRTVGAIDQKITGTNLKDSISDLMNITAFIKTLLDDVDADAALATLTIPFTAYMKTLIDDVDASAAQTTLGISDFIKTLLDDVDASAALATLTIPFSAYMKGLIDDVDADAALTTLTIPFTAFMKTLIDDVDADAALATLTIAFTAYMKTLIDDVDAATARTTLDVDQASKLVAKSANYTITDTDGVKVVDMTTGAGDKTVTLPTAADNSDREITLRKVDSGAGKAILNGEGAEVINDTLLWEVTEQYGYVTVQCNGTKWVVLAHEGAIYEMWQTSDIALGVSTTNWVSGFNLASVPPGVYEISYYIYLQDDFNTYCHATLATTDAAEDDAKYSITDAFHVAIRRQMQKTFNRVLGATATLYLNCKRDISSANGFTIRATAPSYSPAFIRAKRIG